MVESFLANGCYYQQIIQEHEKDFSFDSLVVAKVMDYSLCTNGKDLVDQLRPIASVLDRGQSNGSSLEDACDAWLCLLSEPSLQPLEKIVNNFQAKAAPFPDSYFSAEAISISPHTWWQGTAVYGVDPAFADLAQRPTSSASIEFCTQFSFVHNKIRNRLGV
ncbi:hypothetical protein LSH36_222g04004 [Paralvinella palmiformis]|uniref:Uncharacterized protein n=1 Tax=Paralvinella palmiformis TaxID=53620 RepID=A0AAD9JNP2_9ANNE|nr:hypothetical protein LSH36_222g04004 [Paralvinella palmiformis]